MRNTIFFKDRYSSNIDAGLFLAFAATGVSWQLITRVYLDDAWSLSTVVFGLALLMCVYFWLVIRAPYIRQVKDRGGDNLYFLGFIFTSVTFGIALYKVGLDTDQDISFVLSELGIGLTTTILGLILRITATMGRSGDEEIEDIVRSNLKEQAEQLEKRFIYAAQSAEKANTLTLQIVEEANETLRLVTEAAKTQLVEGNETAAEFFNNALTNTDDSIDSLLKRLDSVEIPTSLITSKIAQALSPLERTIGSISSNLDQLTTQIIEANSKATNGLAISIEALANRINDIDVSEGILSKQLGPQLNELESAITITTNQIGNMNQHLSDYSSSSADNAGAMTQSLDSMNAKLNSTTSKLAQYEEGLLNIETIISHSVDGITKKVGQFTFDESLLAESISKAIQSSSESYRASIEEFSTKIDAMPVPLARLENEMDSLIERLEGKLASHIEGELSTGVESLRTQLRELVDAVKAAKR